MLSSFESEKQCDTQYSEKTAIFKEKIDHQNHHSDDEVEIRRGLEDSSIKSGNPKEPLLLR